MTRFMGWRHASWLAAMGLVLGMTSLVNAQLLVDLDVGNFDPVTGIWTDSAGLGNFVASGSPTVVTTKEGVSAIRFNGSTDFFTGPAAPAGITGVDPTRTVEVWALNPSIAGEETLVAWGRRGGPDGTNLSFNYGNHPVWGALGEWGAPDQGWNFDNSTTTAPAPLQWHHLVYTFDGSMTRVYSDGILMGSEALAPGTLNTHAVDTNGNPLPIRIASQNESNGTATGGLRLSGLIAKVRIHDNALSDTEVLTNWATEVENFPNPVINPNPTPVPTALSSGPVHRYDFSDDIANNGGVVTDLVGGAHGQVLGTGATSNGTSLTLPGGASASAPFVHLPNGIISAHDEITIEGWFTNNQVAAWSRVFDFGSSESNGTRVEFTGPGGAGNGWDALLLSASIGTDTNLQRLEFKNDDPANGQPTGGNVLVDPGTQNGAPSDIAVGQEYHFAVVFDKTEDFLGEPVTSIRLYRNGEFVAEALSATADLSNLNDINNMLGRSNWTGDANTNGTYNEFRIYDRALSADEILGNFQAGPDVINVVPEPATASMVVLGLFGLLALRARKRS